MPRRTDSRRPLQLDLDVPEASEVATLRAELAEMHARDEAALDALIDANKYAYTQIERADRAEAQLRRLQGQYALLELECANLRCAQFVHAHRTTPEPSSLPRATVERALKDLLRVCHPDKWQDHPVATELAKAINALRQQWRES